MFRVLTLVLLYFNKNNWFTSELIEGLNFLNYYELGLNLIFIDTFAWYLELLSSTYTAVFTNLEPIVIIFNTWNTLEEIIILSLIYLFIFSISLLKLIYFIKKLINKEIENINNLFLSKKLKLWSDYGNFLLKVLIELFTLILTFFYMYKHLNLIFFLNINFLFFFMQNKIFILLLLILKLILVLILNSLYK